MISGLFDHAEDRSEPSGATLSFLPLFPAMGMFTHKFHPSFRNGFQDRCIFCSMSIGLLLLLDSVIHGFLRFTTQQLGLEFPLSSLLHPCKRFHGFFWPFEPASIITARIHHVLTGTTTRTYRFVLPFELPALPSQIKQNLTAAASHRQPSHKFRYSRRS